MSAFFKFFYDQRGGIFVLFACLILVVALIRYLAWIFGWGRFAQKTTTDGRIGFVVADFFAKLINDFRHLLALILVLIFAGVLAAAIWISNKDIDTLTKAIQAVTATLGGLIGSIIGYYFGESAVKRSQPDTSAVSPSGPPVQSAEEPTTTPPITPAPAPPPAAPPAAG